MYASLLRPLTLVFVVKVQVFNIHIMFVQWFRGMGMLSQTTVEEVKPT